MYAAAMPDPTAHATYRERFRTTLNAVIDYRWLDSLELARRLDTNVETPRRWRRGTTVPSAEDVGRLAVILDAPLELLLYPPATRGDAFAAMVAYEQGRARGAH